MTEPQKSFVVWTDPPWLEHYVPLLDGLHKDECWVIGSLAAIPDQMPIDLPSGQRQAIEMLEADYAICAYWLAYMRSGRGNSREAPYNTPEFQDQKSFAELLNAEFDLCRGVFEGVDRLPYPDPFTFWMYCVMEWKQWGYDSILGCYESIPKRRKEKGLREIVNCMSESGKNPFSDTDDQKHHYKLIRCALHLKRNNPKGFTRYFWTPFIGRWRDYIRDIRNNKKLKGVIVTEKSVKVLEKGNWQRTLHFPPPETS